MRPSALCLFLLISAPPALAQQAMPGHGAGAHDMHAPAGVAALSAPSEPGQSAFAAIQEIVSILINDPATDWARVNVEALRQHLIDMDNVTLRAMVAASPVTGGARFEATSDDPRVAASIRSMVPAHVAAMNGANGWSMTAETIAGGAALTVTGADAARIRGLGFIGVMARGMHHQAHHLALARGQDPHSQ